MVISLHFYPHLQVPAHRTIQIFRAIIEVMIEVEDMIGIILIMIGRMTEIETEMVAVDQMIDLDLEIMITGIEEDNNLSIFAKMTNLLNTSNGKWCAGENTEIYLVFYGISIPSCNTITDP